MTLRQRIENAAASQAVEKIHGLHQFWHAAGRTKEEFGTIWSRQDNVSWGYNFGRMLGFDEVWYISVTDYDSGTYDTYNKMYERYPMIGGRDPRTLHVFSYHPLATGIIEVAEDGKTARACWQTPGVMFSFMNVKGGRWGASIYERYGADFIREGNTWKYLHEQCASDIMSHLDDKNWAADDFEKRKIRYSVGFSHERPGGDRAGGWEEEAPTRSDEKLLHYYHSATQPVQNTIRWPEPYKTMDDENSYTPLRGPLSYE